LEWECRLQSTLHNKVHKSANNENLFLIIRTYVEEILALEFT
jgi:hypothetical protein